MDTQTEITTINDIAIQMQAEGFHIGPPRRNGLFDGCAIDREVCEGSACEDCGYEGGLGYMSFTNDAGDRYRAVSSCPECKSAHEF